MKRNFGIVSTALLLLAGVPLFVGGVVLSGRVGGAVGERIAAERGPEQVCEECDTLTAELKEEVVERERTKRLHEIELCGDEYLVYETSFADGGEPEYIVSKADRAWHIETEDPDRHVTLLKSHGTPHVCVSEDGKMISIKNERGDVLSTFGRFTRYLLYGRIEWQRVTDEDERQRAIQAVPPDKLPGPCPAPC